mgnify:FL=1|tara:strand:+ start:500 stop:2452 length:1953 start_codon:yes stop_codon:yes gene_type:complete
MKELLNREFLDLSEDRSYPLDEMATGESDQKDTLPNDILADMRLTLDPSLGSSVFVASINISEAIVTMTLVATDSLQSKPGSLGEERYGQDVYTTNQGPYFNSTQDEAFLSKTAPTFGMEGNNSPRSAIIPVAIVTAEIKETNKGKPIRVEPLEEGVGGWVVFGRDLAQHLGKSWGFSHVSQSAVARRSVHFLNFSRIKTLGKFKENSNTASGPVTLDGENGLQVVQKSGQDVYTGSSTTPLVRDILEIGFAGDNLKQNLERYTGPCGVRPDSASCFRGQPITSINGVKPTPSGVLEQDANGNKYNNCIFMIFPLETLRPRVLAWHQEAGSDDDLDSGIVLSSSGLPIKTVCPSPFPEVDDDGNIGTEDCCGQGGVNCDQECEPLQGAANTRVNVNEKPKIFSKHSHLCLSTSLITIHEYNHNLDAVVRTHLTYIGSVGDDFVYAQDISNLSSGYVLHVDENNGNYRLNEGGNTLVGLNGQIRNDFCRGSAVTFIDETGHKVTMTVAPKSIFLTAPSSAHTPLVDVLYTGSGSASEADPSGDYCEKQYGRYVNDSSSKPYELSILPHPDPFDVAAGNYPYELYKVDSTTGNKIVVHRGNLQVTSDSANTTGGAAKPTPRLDSGTITFTVGSDTWSGTIYSNSESSACGAS